MTKLVVAVANGSTRMDGSVCRIFSANSGIQTAKNPTHKAVSTYYWKISTNKFSNLTI